MPTLEALSSVLSQSTVKGLLVIMLSIGAAGGTVVTSFITPNIAEDHEQRIGLLEGDMRELKRAVEDVGASIDHLTMSLDLMNDEYEARSLLNQLALAKLPQEVGEQIRSEFAVHEARAHPESDARLDRLERNQAVLMDKVN